ncbi:CheR family methyltransferase [Alteraurantiacibacter aquimixticola]|uniref:Chemotaxis protein methyltransferase n=1 Tax=Alteraurantiacibacter aquimixticola TaxID=2489173 RepID=A0A4T3EYX5_9SPHN|nr:protein-glutamate O-methyltransferase CheR [Alteraurantiacibacter aquimixticola]TIX49069.1 protein-glutamate O-methyltransferase CheR [Alteraurantiacibacter aquimixticola]
MQVAAIQARGEALVPGVSPQVYSQADFLRVAQLVRQEAGIVLSEGKKMLAYSRLAPLLRKAGCTTFGDYLDRVEQDAALATRTVAALTTNHTYFNREAHHYEHFAGQVRPALLKEAQTGQPVRIWSAGCSSGEEIWTLMMVLLGADRAEGRRIAASNIVALASDLADHAIAAGIRGRYESKAMEAVPEALRRNWCRQSGEETEVLEELRALVRFRQLNLLGDWPFRNIFDVIFCRNVMIYFDHETKERLVWRLANQLRPGGHLYIGHSERVSGKASDLLDLVGPTIYRRKD